MISISAQMRIEKRELVVRLLKKDSDGLTVVEIARKTGISRNTVAVALAELKGAGLIRIRPVGIAKLHYWKGGRR
ncbi:MAG: winged helix-turn-helix domain-containing protein [Nanoarchaeota archaeon]